MAREYAAQARAREEVTSEVLNTGTATMAQLAQMFETDAKTLPKRLKMVAPAGTRRGNKVYRIKEAAQYIVTPGYEIEEYIRQMSPQELPPLLSKEFWNGQRARLEFETKLGMHWPTEEIVEFIGALQNTIRMVLLLAVDDVNREQALTDGQRKVFQRITDAAIVTMGKTVAERLKDYYANRTANRGSRPEPVGNDGRDAVDKSIAYGRDVHAAPDDEEEDHDI